MRKYEVTHPSFVGKALLVYNNGFLAGIDLIETNMTPKQVHDFVHGVPINLSNIAEYTQRSGSQIVHVNWSYSLEDFKHDYPYARNMHLLPAIWAKLCATDLVKISIATKKYRKWTDRERERNPNYVPKIAAGWLKEKQYLNDWDKL